ncbi:NACHT domain-containing protein [Micromonospora sp. WMMD736]|uniref:NACHT domain-containing protein n=1 Tax=Micromonospora sp. WMMD736 TaxID=3404112 RepID=UPI003B9626EA
MNWGPVRRQTLRRFVLVPLIVALMLFGGGLILKAFASGDAEVARLAGYAGIGSFVLAVPASVAAVWQLVASRSSRADVLQVLAGAVSKQWSEESRCLDLDDRLNVAWKPVIAHNTARASGRRQPDRVRPPARTLSEAFLRLPHRRLVLLGSAGAGKTVAAIMLVLDLARESRDNVPVPVLIGLAGWDPSAEDLDLWLARRLAETYPVLSSASARDLLERGSVMPILDGLDEVAPQLRARALQRVSETAVTGRPLVLTCRKNEYDTLIASKALLVADASVWCLEPVSRTELERYLNRRRPRGDRHWRVIVDHVRAKPNGPLAVALTTPLMVSMAHAVYSSADADPADLLNFPDRDSVELHLLDAFLLRVYGRDSARVRQHLAALAELMGDGGEFVWWKLHHTVSTFRPGCLLALAGGLFGGWVGSIIVLPADAGWRRILVVAAFAVLGFFALFSNFTTEPAAGGRRKAGPRPRRLAWTFAQRKRGDSLIHYPDLVHRYLYAAGLGTLAALVVFCGYGSWDLGIILLAYLGLAGIGAISGAMLEILYRWLSAPAPVERAASPLSVLRQDRTAALLALPPYLLVGAMAGVFLGTDLSQMPPGPTNVAAVVIGFAVGFLAWIGHTLTSTAWGWFCLARARLATAGTLPWSLMRFLAGAHRRQLLRQVGPAYEFRHSRLQEFLRSPR